MTEEHRQHPGPDFLPYPRPVLPPPPAAPGPAPAGTPAEGGRRWSRALDGVPPLGTVAIGCGLGAVVLLVLVSWVADRPGPGAVVTLVAAAASLGTGWRALRAVSARDSRALVVAAQTVAALSAVLALVTYAVSGPSDEVAPVTTPTPSPSAPGAAPVAGSSPSPTPTQPVPPPGANRFFVPTVPGAPIVDDPAALGTLEGNVVTLSQQPVKGAVVTVTRAKPGDVSSTPECPTRVTTQTNAAGVYRLQLCQLGDNLGYHVTIQTPRGKAETDLFVNSGNTTVYDVLLP